MARTFYSQIKRDWNWGAILIACHTSARRTLDDYRAGKPCLTSTPEYDDFIIFDAAGKPFSVEGQYYLGSVMSLMPSKKYYTPYACANVTERERERDARWQDALKKVAAHYGAYVFVKKDNPTDVFICKHYWVTKLDKPRP